MRPEIVSGWVVDCAGKTNRVIRGLGLGPCDITPSSGEVKGGLETEFNLMAIVQLIIPI